ncbi:MAG: fatty acid desaturase [Microcystaceae cyanobacterium]
MSQKLLVSQRQYAKELKPLLPPEAFYPNYQRFWTILLHLSIILLGILFAHSLQGSSWLLYLTFLPVAIIMGNSIIALLFSSHEILHNCSPKKDFRAYLLPLFALSFLWTPPTFWLEVHNKEHHNKTNAQDDPDRCYLTTEDVTLSNYVHGLLTPSPSTYPPLFLVGMASGWGIHTLKNLCAALISTKDYKPTFATAKFELSKAKKLKIMGEVAFIIGIHGLYMAAVGFTLPALLFCYFLPIWLGYAGCIFYIYTNHYLCPLTEVNDPLENTVSLEIPAIFDKLHLNFSYHVEHHIFPTLNTNYYPQVRELLLQRYPDKIKLLTVKEAWGYLLSTEKLYHDNEHFSDKLGNHLKGVWKVGL